jgi:7,8-dihydropterin-6-yl-methyl-4-(beta-D-ribofuranosyl)aminobenzene 5'-phosphate synthase
MTTVTILSDNEVAVPRPKGLQAEWGFAAAVGDVLFDTGQTGVAANNAHRLGVGPFETIVLSHGHYDHTKGLTAFVDEAKTVYVHPAAFPPKYRDEEFIGMPYTRKWLESHATVVAHEDPVEVVDGIHALGEIPREYPDMRMGETVDADGNRVADPIRDDQALAVETDDGLGLVLGCGHAGVRNTVAYAERALDLPVHTVVGGTHLRAADPTELDDIVDWLTDHVERVAPTHCTGDLAERKLEAAFGDVYETGGVGATVDL